VQAAKQRVVSEDAENLRELLLLYTSSAPRRWAGHHGTFDIVIKKEAPIRDARYSERVAVRKRGITIKSEGQVEIAAHLIQRTSLPNACIDPIRTVLG